MLVAHFTRVRRMSDTRKLLDKITALKQRLEQYQGSAEEIGSQTGNKTAVLGRVGRLERQVAEGFQHNLILDSSIRQLAETAVPTTGASLLPQKLTSKARRL